MPQIKLAGTQNISYTEFIPWLTINYTYDRGSNIEPTLAMMIKEVPESGGTFLFNSMPSYISIAPGGSLIDESIDQYTNRLYSAYLFSENRVNVPIKLSWNQDIKIQNTWDGTTNEIYNNDTSLSKSRIASNIVLPLGPGLNRIDIILYNHVAINPFILHIDISQIVYAHASQLLPRYAVGSFSKTLTSTSSVDENFGDASGANFLVRNAFRSIDEISDSETPGYSGDFESVSVTVKGQTLSYPTGVESSGNGFALTYSGVTDKTIRVKGWWMAVGIGL